MMDYTPSYPNKLKCTDILVPILTLLSPQLNTKESYHAPK